MDGRCAAERWGRAPPEARAGRPGGLAAGATLLPRVENLRITSATVAVAVARQAIADGVAGVDLADPIQAVQDAMWYPRYRPLA